MSTDVNEMTVYLNELFQCNEEFRHPVTERVTVKPYIFQHGSRARVCVYVWQLYKAHITLERAGLSPGFTFS